MAAITSEYGVIIRETNFNVIGGKRYKTVKMPDGKIWLAENLDFKFCSIGGSGTPTTPNAWYYDNDEATYGWNGYKYGLLYNWYAVKFLEDHKTDLCPGWHVPSITEWNALAIAVGGANNAGTVLKSTTDWTDGTGTDNWGFTALPSGYYNSSFDFVGSYTAFWASTEIDSDTAYRLRLNTDTSLDSNYSDKYDGRSLRLVRDSQ